MRQPAQSNDQEISRATEMDHNEKMTDISLKGGIRYVNACVLAAVNKRRAERGKAPIGQLSFPWRTFIAAYITVVYLSIQVQSRLHRWRC
jgi:hypothetical protein